MKTKEELRKEIDAIDERIASLLSERFSLTDEMGKLKKANELKVFDGKREEEVLQKVKNASRKADQSFFGCEEETVCVYEKIFELSKNRQEIGNKKFALVGGILSHSYSKPLHELFGYEYALKETTENELENLLKSDEFCGFNVTVPFKRLAASFCDVLDDYAKATGTVNVVLKKNGVLYGYNTDYFGMKYAIDKAGIELSGKNALILGTGGTAHTAFELCKNSGAKSVEFVGRKYKTDYNNCYERRETQVVINATPVGMFPKEDELIVDVKKFPALESVFDAVYNPYKTKLVMSALETDKKAAGGFEMLVAQAVKSAEIFLGRNFSTKTIERCSMTLKKKKLNFVFAGMPGAGKTTLGGIFAKKFGLNFFDTDEEFEKNYGVSPAGYITKFGEKSFRTEEKKVLSGLIDSQKNVCIALGGGSFSDREIIEKVCANSYVIVIERALNKLELNGRPLSASVESVARLYEERMPIFRETGDLFIDNNSTIEDAAEKLAEIFK